jgi:hypothetical protein
MNFGNTIPTDHNPYGRIIAWNGEPNVYIVLEYSTKFLCNQGQSEVLPASGGGVDSPHASTAETSRLIPRTKVQLQSLSVSVCDNAMSRRVRTCCHPH